jgi:hypothetical protein
MKLAKGLRDSDGGIFLDLNSEQDVDEMWRRIRLREKLEIQIAGLRLELKKLEAELAETINYTPCTF